MQLHVMRHGPAEDRSSTGRDADRRLTSEGRARVRLIAAELQRARGGAPPPRVLASPLVRARETAEIVASILCAAVPEPRDELSVDADLPVPLTTELAGLRDDALLVGHQPNVEHLVRTLLGGAASRALFDVGRGSAFAVPFAGGFCTAMVITLEPALPLPAVVPQAPVVWRVGLVLDPRRLP